jgi:hypothetical protein
VAGGSDAEVLAGNKERSLVASLARDDNEKRKKKQKKRQMQEQKKKEERKQKLDRRSDDFDS